MRFHYHYTVSVAKLFCNCGRISVHALPVPILAGRTQLSQHYRHLTTEAGHQYNWTMTGGALLAEEPRQIIYTIKWVDRIRTIFVIIRTHLDATVLLLQHNNQHRSRRLYQAGLLW